MTDYDLAHPKALRRVLILSWCCMALPWLGFYWVSGEPLFFYYAAYANRLVLPRAVA